MVEPTVQPPAAVSGEADPAESQVAGAQEVEERDTPLVEAEILVEDVSIDGMCGVY